MTSLESFFFALFEIARSCENFCEIIFGLKQVKALQKRLAEAQIDYLRMPKVQGILTTVAIMCHRYEKLAVLPSVLAIILV